MGVIIDNQTSYSSDCNTYLLDFTAVCPEDSPYPAVNSSETSYASLCPVNYYGYTSRYCNLDGSFSSTNYSLCNPCPSNSQSKANSSSPSDCICNQDYHAIQDSTVAAISFQCVLYQPNAVSISPQQAPNNAALIINGTDFFHPFVSLDCIFTQGTNTQTSTGSYNPNGTITCTQLSTTVDVQVPVASQDSERDP